MLAVFPEALYLKIMMVVIDACVAIKFITSELGTVEANLLLASENDLVAPELMLIETAHDLWKRLLRMKSVKRMPSTGLPNCHNFSSLLFRRRNFFPMLKRSRSYLTTVSTIASISPLRYVNRFNW